jgi:hypothetical protein
MSLQTRTSKLIRFAVLSMLSISAVFVAAPSVNANITIEKNGTLGVIKGIVRDEGGSPISDATVAIFRGGTSKLLKQVSSASDGSFLAKIIPGTYTVLAVAQGFNPITLFGVEVGKSAELTYGFKLERAGSGNTLPEKRLDRNSSKWRIRAMQTQRSIYQHTEGNKPVIDDETAADDAVAEKSHTRRGQTVIETYVASTKRGTFTGVNFATLVPVKEKAQFIFAGQLGKGRGAPQRFETSFTFRPLEDHQVRLNSSIARIGSFDDRGLGQFSVQATDEWKMRQGVVLVLGFDYSKFTGAGSDSSVSPRLGFQLDVDSKTRVNAAFTSQTENKDWAHAIEFEGQSVAFTEPVAVEDFYLVGGKPQMNKSRRLEFGIERVLDNASSIEADIFLDTTPGRGVGLNSISFDALDGDGFGEVVANQQGKAAGLRITYGRRINNVLSTNVGYAFGNGQRLSKEGLTEPSKIFENDFFHSFFAELAATFSSGTNVRTVFRLSPQATVFAIDPFRGRLAIYDPGLSVLVTQSLPTWGLPIRAEAILDARNLLDYQSSIFGEEGGFRLNSQGRMVRGGIQVRF